MAPVDLHVAALLSASSISTTTNPTQPNLLLLFLLLVLIDALPEQIGYVVSEVLKRTVLASLMAAVALPAAILQVELVVDPRVGDVMVCVSIEL